MADDIKTCPVCGKRLPEGTAESQCPACLLQRGLESNTFASQDLATGRPQWQPPTPAQLAGQFPGLEISELIGRGGMGAVYKARQTSLDRVVALKILPPEIGRDSDFARRFAREAQAMAKLNHPHIVAIYDFGQTPGVADGQATGNADGKTGHKANGLFYFLMEFVDGPSLRQVLNRGGVSADEALAIVPQICEALQFAHDHGIVHRDIKPENILLNRQGQVKIADFGLAKLIGHAGEMAVGNPSGEVPMPASPKMPEPQRIVGTPRYMAPEQKTNSESVDHRADIYSLGVVFYQMLTGELPGTQIIAPSQKITIDVRLDEIVLRSLEKQPELRYQHASEIKTQVETVAGTMAGAMPQQTRQSTVQSEPEDLAETEGTDRLNENSIQAGISYMGSVARIIAYAVAIGLIPMALIIMALRSISRPEQPARVSGPAAMAPYNPFITPEMTFGPQNDIVKLRYISPAFGSTGGGPVPMTFPVWNSKGVPVTHLGIHRFIWNQGVQHTSLGRPSGLFLIFSVKPEGNTHHFWDTFPSLENSAGPAQSVLSQSLDKTFGGMKWFCMGIAPRKGSSWPAAADIAIRVAYSPWSVGKTRFPEPLKNARTISPYLNIIGFGSKPDNKSFADIVWQKSLFRKTQRVLAAYTVNGQRELPSITYGSQASGSATYPQRDEYGVPLSQIKYFRILSRPIHTIVFHNVALEPNPPAISKTATKPSPTKRAVMAAEQWLNLIDRGHYSRSWQRASGIFRRGVTPAKWLQSMNTFRKPLGKLLSRKLEVARSETSLPGTVDGHYVIMQFITSFANKKSAIETLTVVLSKNGKWKAAGYFIK